MPVRKKQSLPFPGLQKASVILLFLLLLPHAEGLHAAASPFELEIGELEETGGVPKAEKKNKPQAAGQGRENIPVHPVKVVDPREGAYTKYTVRPGDHLHKILTIRFGLSPARAEKLIPEVMRINGIRDVSRLKIGTVLLIPLPGESTAVETNEASLAKPEKKAGKIAPPEPSPPETPKKEEGRTKRIEKFRDQLFQERSGAPPRPLSKPPAPFANMSGARLENREAPLVPPADEKGFVKELLQEEGFAVTEGGAPVPIGNDPKFSIRADFIAAEPPSETKTLKTLLVLLGKKGCPAVPDSLVPYLESKGFRLVTWCDPPVFLPDSSALAVVSAPSGDVVKLADAVLDALSLNVERNRVIDITVGGSEAPPLHVTVDRYFVRDGKPFFLDFGNAGPDRSALFHLLELAGYGRIKMKGADTLQTVVLGIAKALDIPVEYGKYVLASLPDGYFTLEAEGALFKQPNTEAKTFFLTKISPENPFFDLLKAVQWGTQ